MFIHTVDRPLGDIFDGLPDTCFEPTDRGKKLIQIPNSGWRNGTISILSMTQRLTPLKKFERSGKSGAGWLMDLWIHLWNQAMKHIRLSSPSRTVQEEMRAQKERQNLRQSNSIIEYEALNADQQRVARAVLNDKSSVFITGAAGTGKSFLIRFLIQELRRRDIKVAVTASTGAAADIIEGSTLHSWSGIGLGEDHVDDLFRRLSTIARCRWQDTEVLIIDEISMCGPTLLDKLNLLAQRIRSHSRHLSFGGIQVIFSGDFFQLPPVSSFSNFCFESKIWNSLKPQQHELKMIIRQKNRQFIETLMEIRKGYCTVRSHALLSQCITKARPTDNILPTMIVCHNRQAEHINQRCLDQLGNVGCHIYCYMYSRPPRKCVPEKLPLKV